MRRKRVALISEHASPLVILGGVDSGGQNVYVGQLARLLPKLGYQVDVFTRRDSPVLPDIVAGADTARIIHVPAGPAAPVRKEDMLPLMGEFTEFLIRYSRRHRPYDLVHANFFMSALVAAEFQRAAGVPFVVTFHALGRVRRRHQGGQDAFPEERLAMVPRKGVDNVIRGLARLRRDHGISARLLVVGGESETPDPAITPEIGRLLAIAEEEAVTDAVTFVGSRGRGVLCYDYCAADVFVTTPWYEPFGITPVEAAACGTPVVGAAVGGIRTTVVDGETGYLVPPRDPDALADRLA
jgi:glycosyltransferase involved in cell wall biosynthesis